MKNVKSLLVLLTVPLLLFSFSNCGGAHSGNNMSKFTQDPPFKIAKAYYQNWVAGVEEGGSGTNVHVLFSEIDPDVVIQNIYFKNHILEAKGNINEPLEFVGYLKNAMQRDIIMDADPTKEAQNTPSNTFPFELVDNEAVVEYWFDGKKNYYKISDLSQKDIIPYPQGNPNAHE